MQNLQSVEFLGRWLNQIPQVSIQILKHSHSSIILQRWWTYDFYALVEQVLIVSLEVVGVQEQENSTTGLVADS